MKKIKNGTRRFENGWIRVTVKGTPISDRLFKWSITCHRNEGDI